MTKLQGNTCPYCRHWDVISDSVEIDYDYAAQDCICQKCDRGFRVVYKVDYLTDDKGEEIADNS